MILCVALVSWDSHTSMGRNVSWNKENTNRNISQVRIQDSSGLVIPPVDLQKMGPEILYYRFVLVGTVAVGQDTSSM